MIKKLYAKLYDESANALVENVIILPLIFIIIYAIIMTAFVIHDRSTLEAAAKRGAIYIAHCISDPNYSVILEQSGNQEGTLDVSIDLTQENNEFSFTGIGDNIQAYRYVLGFDSDIDGNIEREIRSIVESTRIPWRTVEVDDIQYSSENKLLYQDVTVTLKADYPIPEFFGAFGIETDYEYTVTAKMAVNDPDEFIRNADLIVDIIVEVDSMLGNKISNVTDKIKEMASNILSWLEF